MRWSFITRTTLILTAAAFQPIEAQLSRAGDLDPLGRVLMKVKVSITGADGLARPITGLRMIVVSETAERVEVTTDDVGNAVVWLKPASYRIASSEPVRTSERSYSWDMIVRIEPGTGVINLTERNSSAAPTSAVPGESPGNPPAPDQSTQPRLRVFVDCQTDGCDLDYFRNEIPFVDHMRDRADASVHMLVTSAVTGGDGLAYTINFIGQRDLSGLMDTTRYAIPTSVSADERRASLARILKLGLVRYLLRSADATRLRLTYEAPGAGNKATAPPKRDPWNLWVFRTTAGGNFSGEQMQRYLSLYGTMSVNRTSEAWKFLLSFNGGYDEGRYTFSDGSRYNDYAHSYGANHRIVRSIGSHWAIGERASLKSSTFLNQKLALYFAPTIEVNAFPYSQSTRRRFTVAYSVGIRSFVYEDTTIFNRIEEVRPDHSVTASIDFKQPWGSALLALEGSAFLDDFSKRHATFYTELDLRLFKGFSLNPWVGVSLIHDQLYLAKGTLTDEQILLRRRSLASTYTYYGGLGLSYTFGSIFNNVVNPRFDAFK